MGACGCVRTCRGGRTGRAGAGGGGGGGHRDAGRGVGGEEVVGRGGGGHGGAEAGRRRDEGDGLVAVDGRDLRRETAFFLFSPIFRPV